MLISFRWICGIVKKDWQQHVSTIAILLAGMFVPLFAPGDELKQELMLGVVLAAAYAYANYIFTTERTSRTLTLLLGLPVRPVPLILGKFVSLYSMCLLTVNLPGIFLVDPRALYLMNGLLIGLAAICMASTVLWDSQMAPVAPVLLVALTFHWVAYKDIKPYELQLATAGLILAPIIAITSAFLFKRQVAVK